MIKCDCCGKSFKSLNRDYRVLDGIASKYLCCDNCVNLSDMDWHKQYIKVVK
jgi:hypothetical protein